MGFVASDVLSDVLGLLRLRGEIYCRSEFTAPFAVRFPAGSHFHVVESGSCWVSAPGSAPVHAAAGDLVLLPRVSEHTIGDRPGRRAASIDEVKRRRRKDDLLRWGGGAAATTLICATPTRSRRTSAC